MTVGGHRSRGDPPNISMMTPRCDKEDDATGLKDWCNDCDIREVGSPRQLWMISYQDIPLIQPLILATSTGVVLYLQEKQDLYQVTEPKTLSRTSKPR